MGDRQDIIASKKRFLHVQKCLDACATKEQILKAASVAVMMGGSPVYTHIPIIMEALEALQG
jgi:alkylhydroperoxidase/carboxymuconolactone decarboxylase family protein YurZ